jgi:hypothetical protein
MYDLLLELKAYLEEYCGGGSGSDGDSVRLLFPTVFKMKERGYERLHMLIQYYGGRKFLASRLGMEHSITVKKKRTSKNQDYLVAADMNWGPFDLQFGIDLLEFVRNEQLKRRPPLRYPVIDMPSQTKLLASGEKGVYLDEKIQEYGGYENVARRLGLAYFFRKI